MLLLTKESIGVQAVLVISLVGRTRPVSIGKGVVQGRVDGPFRFKSVMDVILKRTINKWTAANVGIMVGTVRLTHIVWADNVWLFANSHDMYNKMVGILSCELYRAKLRWKPASLEYMTVWDLMVTMIRTLPTSSSPPPPTMVTR